MAIAAAVTDVVNTITGAVTTMNRYLRKKLGLHHPVFAILLFALMTVLCTPAGSSESNTLDTFAKCLADKKTTMYGSFLCAHCDDQKKLFGSSFRYVPYVECSVRGSRQMTFPCIAAQIRYTPTWIFADNERRTGLQPLKDLSAKTGCTLP